MIDEVDLHDLFAMESEQHLQLLEVGLLHLVSDPADGETLEEVFRAAHNLKGGAAKLGLHSIERQAYGLEHLILMDVHMP